jgi:hypothetical protein
MKLTREQIKKWNAGCKNGFTLDIQHALIWSEKELVCTVNIDDHTLVTITLRYDAEYDPECKYRQTGRQIPVAVVQKWNTDPESKFMQSTSGYYKENAGEPQNKKLFSVLQKLTGTIDRARLVDLVMNGARTFDGVFC